MIRGLNLLSGTLLIASLAALPCCQATTLKVPASAMHVGGGSGDVAYRAADTGHLYVYDRSADKMCYSGLVKSGQLVLVDTENNRILVDGKPVVEQLPLTHSDQYDVYIDTTNGVPVVEKRTVIEREVHE